jgi:hypothetical protein
MNKEIAKALASPFPAELIKWRAGATTRDKSKAMALPYIDARHVFNRLDDVVGPGSWETVINETSSGRVLCTLIIDGVSKTDGAGATDIEGEKGAISDAIKRAAVQWGIGRYLYDLPTEWMPYDAQRKRLVTNPGESKSVAKRKESPMDAFAAACAKKVHEGIEFFESLGHGPEDAELLMNERVADILKGMVAAVGKSYKSYYEIEIREHRESFYLSLAGTVRDMIAEMDEEADSE